MNKNLNTFEELLVSKYGKPCTARRDEFDAKSKTFMSGELIKETRKKSKVNSRRNRPCA